MATRLMLSRSFMLARRENCGPEYDGQYIVGVKTTGVYCLPSCKPPRLAKAENIEFFATPQDAREAGLRPCKLCRPDDFYLGHDAGEMLIEQLVDRITRHPEQYCTARSMVCDSGVGTNKLHELFRVHYHTTPSEMLTRKRVARARRLLLESCRAASDIAFDVGFESLSAFNTNFRKHSATTPAAYRKMAGAERFDLDLPENYPIGRMLAYLGRDPESPTEQVCGRTYRTAMRAGEQAIVVEVTFQRGRAQCRVRSAHPLVGADFAGFYERLLAVLGLTGDPGRFEAQLATRPDVSGLIVRQKGLRVPLASDPFDGLIWAISSQQATLPRAFSLRRRLIEQAGSQVAPGLYLPPEPARIAALEPNHLESLGFTRRCAGNLINAARAVVTNGLDIDDLVNAPATRVERELRGLDGMSPWATQYVLMRVCGFQNCVPAEDRVLSNALKEFFDLHEYPGPEQTLALMEHFSPYRSLATFHLWQRSAHAA